MQFSIVLTQMGILVLLIAVGYACAKLGVTGPDFNKNVSSITMNVLISGTILASSMTGSIQLTPLETLRCTALLFVVFAVSALLGFFASRLPGLGPERRGVALTGVMLMNSVFVAYPVIQAIYGSDGVFYASLSNIPFNLLAYTLGTGSIRGERGGFRAKDIFSAPLVATLIGVTITLTGLKVPDLLVQTCSTLGKASVPMSMLVVGSSLAAVPVRRALGDWRVYVLSLVRLIVCPAAAWLVLRLLIRDPLVLGVDTLLAAAPAAMMVTVFAVQYERDEGFAAQLVFVSTVLSAVTMPLMSMLLL